MKLPINRLLSFVSLVVIVYAATSFNLPFKIVANNQETESVPVATTPPVPGSTTESVVPDGQETALQKGSLLTI